MNFWSQIVVWFVYEVFLTQLTCVVVFLAFIDGSGQLKNSELHCNTTSQSCFQSG